jgi:hypothetical protein
MKNNKKSASKCSYTRLPDPHQSVEGNLQFILDHGSCLVAAWDGQPAQGRAGTGELVCLVRQRKLPLIWIRAGNRLPGTETPISLVAEQGEVSVENLPKQGG